MASFMAPDTFKTAAELSHLDETALALEIRAKFKALKTPDFDIYSELTVREMETLVAVSQRKGASVATLMRRIITGESLDRDWWE